jgi:acetyl-CoA C-acetyltransferase
MNLERVYIVSGARTPIGRFGGTMRSLPVYKFTAVVLNEVVRRAGIDASMVEEVVMGHAYQNGECANGARMALLEAGWPVSVTGISVDRRCCSGLDAVALGAMKIQTGNADIVVAGGMESMSQAEMYVPGDIRWGG